MKARQIEAFRAVVDAGGITPAAERLRISQPAVSKLIMDLERATGLELFVRHKGRLVATHEARLLYEEVDRLFLGLDRIDRYANDLRNLKTGSIHLACLPSLGLRILPELIARFVAEKPDAKITAHIRASSKITDWLLGQQMDLGISMLPLDHRSVVTESLVKVDAVCVVPPSHALANRAFVTPADLQDEPFIALGREDRSGQLIGRTFEESAAKVKVKLETNLSETACQMVASNAGVSIVDPFTTMHYQADRLVVLPFRPSIKFELFLLYPALRPRSKLLDSFIDALRGEIERLASALRS